MRSARLYVSDSTGPRTVTIGSPVFTIGRHHDRDLLVHGTEVSREHAVITLVGDRLVFKDTSKFGSFLNGERRILEVVLENLEDSADGLVASLLRAVERFSAGLPQCDDITVLVVRFRGA